ncbi:MAG: glycosyltransferase [Desulfuromonas sp.]|nr:MAG: glycosyltransferase [Desulfuromonas sp.]
MKVTVVTLCLNEVDFLSGALQSVADQDHDDLEHLVIDGGSTDGSVEIVRRFAERNPRLRWWSGQDEGISAAMNRGLHFATGELIAFLHADDCYAGPQSVSEVVRAFQDHPGAVWLTAGIREISADDRVLRVLPVRRYSRRRLLRNNIVFHPSTFVRRDVLDSLGGFDTELKYAMDYDLWLRLARIARPVVLEKIVACFRVHPGSLSTVQRINALDEEYTVRKRFLPGNLARFFHWFYQVIRRTQEKGRGGAQ